MRHAAAGRIGVVPLAPVADLDEGAMGILRGLLVSEGLEHPAVLAAPQGQTLDLQEPRSVLGFRGGSGHAREECLPVLLCRCSGRPLGAIPLEVRPGACLDRRWDAGEPQSLSHQLPGRPGGGRREGRVGESSANSRRLVSPPSSRAQASSGSPACGLSSARLRRGPGCSSARSLARTRFVSPPPARSRSSRPRAAPGQASPCTGPGCPRAG